jgi:hypothetical protein
MFFALYLGMVYYNLGGQEPYGDQVVVLVS